MGCRSTALLLLGACSFNGTAKAPDAAHPADAAGPSDDAVALFDAPADAGTLGPACGGKMWIADFDVDPTTIDLDHDGTMDWAIRNATPIPAAQISNGMWHKPANTGMPLDSQPKQPFTTRTIVHARMRATSDVTSTSQHGAIFWINVGYAADHSYAPLFVDITLSSGNQHVRVFIKDAQGQEIQPAGAPQINVSGGSMIAFTLDLDPANLVAHFSLDGVGGISDLALVRQPPGSNPGDQWATLDTYAGAGDFDSVTVEVCP